MTATTTARLQWRAVDIVVAAVLGVATGLIFWVWNSIGYAGYEALNTLTPGFGGLATGLWYLGGPLGMLVIRKPGAAIFVELLAAAVSAGLGNQWGLPTLASGVAQGLGAEIVFALVAYRAFNAAITVLSGALAGAAAWLNELVVFGNAAKGTTFNAIYLVANVLSGALLAGVVALILVRLLAATGALDRFAAGRARLKEI